jgi:SAM-dependent methyltransferase
VSWIDYWSGETTLYVNARHKRVHYEGIAHDIVGCLPGPDARVVDYGCGDTQAAQVVADACARLYLCESAASTRERLTARYAGRPNIEAVSVEAFEQLSPGTIDMIVANSVVQYLSPSSFAHFLGVCRDKLAPGGQLVLADVIPRNLGPLQDAAELLKFAAANGFLFAAGAGLVRSFFSDYRRVRQQLGLLQFDEAEIVALLAQAGFTARRRYPNLGHNGRRMTFFAFVAGRPPGA